jgi:hypothetical protein
MTESNLLKGCYCPVWAFGSTLVATVYSKDSLELTVHYKPAQATLYSSSVRVKPPQLVETFLVVGQKAVAVERRHNLHLDTSAQNVFVVYCFVASKNNDKFRIFHVVIFLLGCTELTYNIINYKLCN